jgi:hypothetical protein
MAAPMLLQAQLTSLQIFFNLNDEAGMVIYAL